jgi:hypothetical protein
MAPSCTRTDMAARACSWIAFPSASSLLRHAHDGHEVWVKSGDFSVTPPDLETRFPDPLEIEDESR